MAQKATPRSAKNRWDRGSKLLGKILDHEDQCRETGSGYLTRNEVERRLERYYPDDQRLAHYEQYLVLMGRAYGGYDGDQESENGFYRNHLDIAHDPMRETMSREGIQELEESLAEHPTPAKCWALVLLAGNPFVSVEVAKVLAKSELMLPVCLTAYLAPRLRTGIWIREEISYADAGERHGPRFTLLQMQQCDALGLFPPECCVTQSLEHPMKSLAKRSRNPRSVSLVDDQTVLERLDQFMIRPEILEQLLEERRAPIMGALLTDQTIVSGSFLAWALTDQARAGDQITKEQEMLEYYSASDLDMPTGQPTKEAATQIISVLEDLFDGITATFEHRPFMKIFVGTTTIYTDHEILARIPEPYLAMECRIIRQSHFPGTFLPGIDFPAEIADRIQIKHPALLREIQVYQICENRMHTRRSHIKNPLNLFGHVIQYHFECVRGMLTNQGVRLSFLAAFSLIHGVITSPWNEEMDNSVRCCAKYLRRGFQMYYRSTVNYSGLLCAISDLEVDLKDAEMPLPYPDDDQKDHIFQTLLRSRPKRAIGY